MLTIGIDPGLTGGVAVIDKDGEILETALFTSWLTMGALLTKWFNYAQDGQEGIQGCIIGLEKVNAVPGNGVKSLWTFGKNVGGWEALLEIYRLPHVLVPPAAWQPKMLGSFPKGESKKAAQAYCARRYPNLSLRKADTGISDALCIALYTKQFKG